MSGDDKSTDEILDDIRTPRGGATPPPRAAPEAAKVGLLKGSFLLILSLAVATQLQDVLNAWLNLPDGGFSDTAAYLPVLVLFSAVCNARPATIRNWGLLAAACVAGGTVSALSEAAVSWLYGESTSGSWEELLLFLAAGLPAAMVLPTVFRTADRLGRPDGFIFPRDAEESEGGAG